VHPAQVRRDILLQQPRLSEMPIIECIILFSLYPYASPCHPLLSILAISHRRNGWLGLQDNECRSKLLQDFLSIFKILQERDLEAETTLTTCNDQENQRAVTKPLLLTTLSSVHLTPVWTCQDIKQSTNTNDSDFVLLILPSLRHLFHGGRR